MAAFVAPGQGADTRAPSFGQPAPADVSIHNMLPRHVCRDRRGHTEEQPREEEEAKEDKEKAVLVAAHILADSLLLDLLGALTLLLCNPWNKSNDPDYPTRYSLVF